MAEKVDIWMPMYIAEYLADTMHLSCEQSGAYLHLLFHSWKVGKLPNDTEQLRRIARVETKPWPAVWKAVKGFWTEAEDGGLVQGRLEHERNAWADKKEKSVAKAKAAVAAREARREAERIAKQNSGLSPRSSQDDPEIIPSSSSSPVSSNEETKTRASDDGFPQRPYTSIAKEIICAHPKALARSLTALDVTHAQLTAVLEAVQSECRNSDCSPEMAEEMILRWTRDIASAVQEWPPGEQPRVVRDIVPFFRERDYRRPIEQWRYQGAGNRNRNQDRSDRNIDALRRAGGLE